MMEDAKKVNNIQILNKGWSYTDQKFQETQQELD